MEKLFTRKEAASLLHISIKTLDAARETGYNVVSDKSYSMLQHGAQAALTDRIGIPFAAV